MSLLTHVIRQLVACQISYPSLTWLVGNWKLYDGFRSEHVTRMHSVRMTQNMFHVALKRKRQRLNNRIDAQDLHLKLVCVSVRIENHTGSEYLIYDMHWTIQFKKEPFTTLHSWYSKPCNIYIIQGFDKQNTKTVKESK